MACKHGVPDQNVCNDCELGPVPQPERKWRVSYHNSRPYSQITDTETGELVAEVYGQEDRSGYLTAIFIASAPQMYEALHAALEVMTSQKTTLEEQADAITAVQMSLQRAEGRR